MNFFKSNELAAAETRLIEESLYAEALREIQSGQRRDGIWARALVECGMDQNKAAGLYIELRVQSLKDELLLHSKQLEIAKQAQVEKQKELLRLQQQAEDEDRPRHMKCGGIIDRTERSGQYSWSCRKCGATGKFRV